MTQYVTLLGAEAVERASARISESAHRIESAAREMQAAVEHQGRIFDSFLETLEVILSNYKP